MQGLKIAILRGKSAQRGRVHHQNRMALETVQIDRSAINRRKAEPRKSRRSHGRNEQRNKEDRSCHGKYPRLDATRHRRCARQVKYRGKLGAD